MGKSPACAGAQSSGDRYVLSCESDSPAFAEKWSTRLVARQGLPVIGRLLCF
jgi:hypothetical protein